MSNTSTIHIKTDFDCKVYDYGQELGTTKADAYFNIELRKGEHELSFLLSEDENISKTICYIVAETDCDYKLEIIIADSIGEKAKRYYDYESYTSAFSLFLICAEKGYAESQNYLGLCFLHGYGVNQDYHKAWYWFKKAAEQGNADAQSELSLCYTLGIGVEKDRDKANFWSSKLVEQALQNGY
jgi:TPR repeat protein